MKENKHTIPTLLILVLFMTGRMAMAQDVPSSQENMAYLVTFGSSSDHSWGDDDFSQTVFFSIPKSQTSPFYLRLFDPEVAGESDEANGAFDTKTKFSIYGGPEAYSNKDARYVDPIGNYKSGILIFTKTYGNDVSTDQKWISLGPFNPMQGEYVAEFDSYVFKVVVDGLGGNDGNLYKFFLSVKNNENLAIQGANAFAYEYSVRLQTQANSVAHVYPFADNLVSSFNIRCFDFDDDGQIKLFSSVKNGHPVTTSDDNEWSESHHAIREEERNKCLDLQIIKKDDFKNDIVFYITNEYNVPVPFFAAPLGGMPRYKYKIKINTSAKTYRK